MADKNTIQDCHNLANKHCGKCLSTEYINCKTKLLWQCKRGHIFEFKYNDVDQGSWCVKCNKIEKQNLMLQICKDLAFKNNGKFFSEQYIGSTEIYLWECAEGHLFKMRFCNVNNNGHWCPICRKVIHDEKCKKYTASTRKTKEFCQELAKKQNGYFLSEQYINATEKYIWKCELGHIWSAKYPDIKKGHWCPVCAITKRENTFLERYGAKNAAFILKFQEKKHNTCLEKYGNKSPFQNETVKQKIKETCLEKYGVENPSQNKEISLKAAKSMMNSYVFPHWKTNEEVICVGSYEKAVVEYLNKNKIEFDWQPKVFIMSDGKTYRPDFYLPEGRLWVEVKGYFRKDAKEKWEWFHKQYPNSELWNKKMLKQMEIL